MADDPDLPDDVRDEARDAAWRALNPAYKRPADDTRPDRDVAADAAAEVAYDAGVDRGMALAAAGGRARGEQLAITRPANTHYAVLHFGGDLAGEHPDDDLRGACPRLTLIAAGPEDFCWEQLRRWTAAHPLRLWETAEVVARDPSVVRDPTTLLPP